MGCYVRLLQGRFLVDPTRRRRRCARRRLRRQGDRRREGRGIRACGGTARVALRRRGAEIERRMLHDAMRNTIDYVRSAGHFKDGVASNVVERLITAALVDKHQIDTPCSVDNIRDMDASMRSLLWR